MSALLAFVLVPFSLLVVFALVMFLLLHFLVQRCDDPVIRIVELDRFNQYRIVSGPGLPAEFVQVITKLYMTGPQYFMRV